MYVAIFKEKIKIDPCIRLLSLNEIFFYVELNEKKFYLKIVATLIKSSTTNKYHNNITLAQNLEKKKCSFDRLRVNCSTAQRIIILILKYYDLKDVSVKVRYKSLVQRPNRKF
jgi:hypothetical protein